MKVKLFCLPYAGGSASLYNKWRRYLEPELQLEPIELAGRGARINERLYNDRKEAVEDVFNVIKAKVAGLPYIIFGHSMGASIAYDLAHKIKDSELHDPLHLFFSGSSAPHVKDEKNYHLMEPEQFKAEVLKLGGTPPEFFKNIELMDIFLPLLRSDFKIAEARSYDEDIQPLTYNITVFQGKDDELTQEQCESWRLHTSGNCKIHYFDGGHFFIHEEEESITHYINQTLLQSLYALDLS